MTILLQNSEVCLHISMPHEEGMAILTVIVYTLELLVQPLLLRVERE